MRRKCYRARMAEAGMPIQVNETISAPPCQPPGWCCSRHWSCRGGVFDVGRRPKVVAWSDRLVRCDTA